MVLWGSATSPPPPPHASPDFSAVLLVLRAKGVNGHHECASQGKLSHREALRFSQGQSKREPSLGDWGHSPKRAWTGCAVPAAPLHLLVIPWTLHWGFPDGASGKEPAYQRPGFDPWVGRIPWRRKWQPTPVILPGESCGQRSLAGCSHGITKRWSRLSTHARTHTPLVPGTAFLLFSVCMAYYLLSSESPKPHLQCSHLLQAFTEWRNFTIKFLKKILKLRGGDSLKNLNATNWRV